MPEPGKIKKKKPHRFYDYSLLFTIIFLTVHCGRFIGRAVCTAESACI